MCSPPFVAKMVFKFMFFFKRHPAESSGFQLHSGTVSCIIHAATKLFNARKSYFYVGCVSRKLRRNSDTGGPQPCRRFNVTIPSCPFSALNGLYLSRVAINGSFPTATNFPVLPNMVIVSCTFTEDPIFPSDYLTSITAMYIGSIDFRGQSLPTAGSPLLISFPCRNCSLGGSIPHQLTELPAIEYIDLESTSLTGSIPA
jgi:hypothetical protein